MKPQGSQLRRNADPLGIKPLSRFTSLPFISQRLSYSKSLKTRTFPWSFRSFFSCCFDLPPGHRAIGQPFLVTANHAEIRDEIWWLQPCPKYCLVNSKFWRSWKDWQILATGLSSFPSPGRARESKGPKKKLVRRSWFLASPMYFTGNNGFSMVQMLVVKDSEPHWNAGWNKKCKFQSDHFRHLIKTPSPFWSARNASRWSIPRGTFSFQEREHRGPLGLGGNFINGDMDRTNGWLDTKKCCACPCPYCFSLSSCLFL